MFAAQLLRILQTIPSDVESKTCVDDSAQQDMTMKENQNETLHSLNSFGEEVDPLEFDSKKVYEINGLRRDTHPSPFELKGKDEYWNPFVDDLSMDNQNITGDSGGEEFQSGLSCRMSSSEMDGYLLSSVPNAQEKMQSRTEREHTVACEEFVHHDETKSKDSRSPIVFVSNPFEKDNNLFSDKIVCYKEVNYHVVKDICIDDGVPLNRDFLTYNSKNDQNDHSVMRPLNDDSHCKATEAIHEEALISDELAATSLENMNGNIANEHGSEEECHDILLSEGRPKSLDKETTRDCDEKDSLQKGKTVTHASGEYFIDSSLPIQEFGTRSFLRSFLNSLDDGAVPDQISSGKVITEGCTPSSAETGQKEDIQPTKLHYNSKVENGSITFNFNSPETVLGGATNVGPENIKEQSVDSRDTTDENAHDHISKDESRVHSSGDEVVNSHEDRDPENDAVVSFRRYDEEEASFSASGVINYSGPIAFSGSLSDGSASCVNSGRSFAFPILQNEWSSSPVRMTKGDGRHFRKHRGWRLGLLCCRF